MKLSTEQSSGFDRVVCPLLRREPRTAAGRSDAGDRIRTAVSKVIGDRAVHAPDLDVRSSAEVGNAVIAALKVAAEPGS